MSHNEEKKTDLDKWGRELGISTIMLHHAVGESMGLSAIEHKAAHILLRFGPMTAGELAERTNLTTGAVTGLVDRLEKAGLVQRQHDQQDRRRVIIAPTGGSYAEVYELPQLKREILDLLSQYDDREAAVIIDFALKASEAIKNETQRLREAARAQK